MDIFKLVGRVMVDTAEAEKSISSTGSKADGLGNKLAAGIKTAGEWALGLTAAAAAVGAGMFALGKSAAETLDTIDKGAQSMNLTTDAYQEWSYILSQNGTDISNLQGWMNKLTNGIDDLGKGTTSATEKFDRLGLSYEELEAKSPEEQFQTVIEALQNVQDESERAAIRNDLFGNSSSDLAALLNQESGAIDELKDKAHDMGMVIEEDAISAGVKFQDSLDTLTRSASGLGTQFAADLLPILTAGMEWLTDELPKIKEKAQEIWDKISPIFDAFGGAFESIRSAFASGTSDMGLNWEGFSDWLGETALVIADVITQVGNTIAWLVSEATTDGTTLNTTFKTIGDVVDTTMTAIQDVISVVTSAISGDWSGAWDGIKKTVADVIDGIKNMLSRWNISLPSIKMPHFSVRPVGWQIGDLLQGSIPSLGISWYAKAMDNAMLLDRPTIFGASGGKLLGAGEAGAEVVAGADKLSDMIGQAVSDRMSGLEGTIRDLSNAIKGMQVVLDSGAVVGALTSDFNAALGDELRVSRRGMA